ncbi:hypothetical protein [Penaeicola halotolerans]|uniref:hypothetical protein n=1 Tax=Penaeicola halotolerans TaxID=2793196 RepID=UPI001CF81AF0|nr:hypothetical protein [Penaeicola halotolerans]
MNRDEKITIFEAYKAMFKYLENLYELTESDDLAGFLGSMTLLEDGKPADQAVWDDWVKSINKVINNA